MTAFRSSQKKKGTIKSKVVVQQARATYSSHAIRHVSFHGPTDSMGYWRNRKRASLARTRYWDRNPDTPFRYGVVGNISACHADARGSIPRFGDFFFFINPHKKNQNKKSYSYARRDSNSGFPACEAGVITGLDHARSVRPPGLEPES